MNLFDSIRAFIIAEGFFDVSLEENQKYGKYITRYFVETIFIMLHGL